MKRVFILFLIFFCLAICSDTAEAAKYGPDLTVSRVTVDAAGNNTGGLSIKNVGNRPAGWYEVLVYFKKTDGSYFKQYYRTAWNGTKLGANYTKHYANVFDGSQTVTGLVRVNPHQQFTELNYYNNVRYFSMQKKAVSTYNVTEGVRRYDPGQGHDVVTSTYTGAFSNGAYNPILGDSYIDGGSDNYVNGIRILPYSVPSTQHRLIVRGITYSPDSYNKRIYSTSGSYSSLTRNATGDYYYLNYPDTFVPAYLNFASSDSTSWIYGVYNTKIGSLSIEIDGQSVGSYDVEEVLVYSGVRYLLHNATYVDGSYDPVVANPPYVRIGIRDRYINWIGVYFDVPLQSKVFILRGANSAATIKVKDGIYNVFDMVWDSDEEYFISEIYSRPVVIYIDAGEYDAIDSYNFLNSFQPLSIEYNGQNIPTYDVYEGYWENSGIDNGFIELYSHTFYTGGYDPVQADPQFVSIQYYVNHLGFDLNFSVPANAVSSLLILKGTTEVNSPPQVQLSDDSMVVMLWSSVKNYYFLFIVTDLIKSVVIDVWSDDYWAYDTLDSFGNIIFEFMYMPRSWSWS